MSISFVLLCIFALIILLLVNVFYQHRKERFTEPAGSKRLSEEIESLIRTRSNGADPGIVFGLNSVSNGEGTCSPGPPKQCVNFYTWPNFLKALDKYNAQVPREKHAFGYYEVSDVTKRERARLYSMAAFFANAHIESGGFNACKERVLIDGRCDESGDCSGGQLGHYTAAEAKVNGWTRDMCYLNKHVGADGEVPEDKKYDRPKNGCTDWQGNPVSDSRHCWFGRGALQISWPGNYGIYSPPGIDLCKNPDLICRDPIVAWQASIHYWGTKVEKKVREWAKTENKTMDVESMWTDPRVFQQVIKAIGPADGSMMLTSVGNTQRHCHFVSLLEKLGEVNVRARMKSALSNMYKDEAIKFRCGKTFADASQRCDATLCMENSCPAGESCFADVPSDHCTHTNLNSDSLGNTFNPLTCKDSPNVMQTPSAANQASIQASSSSTKPSVATQPAQTKPPAVTQQYMDASQPAQTQPPAVTQRNMNSSATQSQYRTSTPAPPNPTHHQPKASTSGTGTHTVVSGDTCYRISNQYCGRPCMSNEECSETLCNVDDCGALQIGQSIRYNCNGCQS